VLLMVDETFGNRVSAFDIEPDGSLTNRRSWATFGELPTAWRLNDALASLVVAPDGCALDAEGALWIADALNGRVIRVREGGDIVQEITVGTGVFACGLGGADGRTLFMCAAPDFDEHARAAARAGQLRDLDPGRGPARWPPLTAPAPPVMPQRRRGTGTRSRSAATTISPPKTAPASPANRRGS